MAIMRWVKKGTKPIEVDLRQWRGSHCLGEIYHLPTGMIFLVGPVIGDTFGQIHESYART